MASFVRKTKKKIEILKDEESIITLRDVDIDSVSKKFNLSENKVQENRSSFFTSKISATKNLRESDGSITSSKGTVKDIVESAPFFTGSDTASRKSKLPATEAKVKTATKKNSELASLTSSLEKLGISNKEIIATESYFKDDAGKEIKMLLSGTNEYITRDTRPFCWWCRHNFSTDWHPLGLPIKYVKTKSTNEFLCEGIFCSFNCIMAYLHDHDDFKYKDCGSLVGLLYRMVVGRDCWLERIHPAPSWKNLREYGGRLTIDEFRNTFNKLKIVEMSYVMDCPLNMRSLHTINLVERS